MSSELTSAEIIAPPRPRLGAELVLVFLVAAAVLVPGIWRYSLLDPWETHYGEVAREMLEEHDLVHTQWRGTFYSNPGDNEGFRSKPVFMFWMMAAGMRALGVGDDGGYSGEMVQDARTMIGIRLPFVLSAIAGLMLMWWMLARLVNRRLAWLALLVVGSTPMFCLIARQGIPDMPMTACTIGAVSLFVMALEDGERLIAPLGYLFRRRVAYDARHVILGIAVGFVLVQAAYLVGYFLRAPQLAIRGAMPHPALWLPGLTVLLIAAISRDGWVILRLPFVLVGGVIAAIVNEPMPAKRRDQSLWRHVVDDILYVWDRHALDKYLLRILPLTLVIAGIVIAWTDTPVTVREVWRTAGRIVDRLFAMSRITTMRQLYLIAAYFLLGISILAKGPPGFTVVAGVMAFHVILLWRWRPLWNGDHEIKRALLVIIAVVLPWHLAMYLKDGVQFVEQYVFQHILNRAGSGTVDKSLGTFAYYTNQIGHGMWLWASLLPAAVVGAFARASRLTREGRVRFIVTLWAVIAVFVFCFVQTKFHHYILPAIPPLALLVAWYLDDLLARRERMHPMAVALAIGIVLLACRDLMFEPDRWVEMFVYRYDRPWPGGEPYQVDPSDGFLALAIAAVIGLAIMGTRFVRLGVAVVGTVGLAICVWALQVYMPHAGTHWGMREAMRSYYEQRTIYGHKRVFFARSGASTTTARASTPRTRSSSRRTRSPAPRSRPSSRRRRRSRPSRSAAARRSRSSTPTGCSRGSSTGAARISGPVARSGAGCPSRRRRSSPPTTPSSSST